jgi:cytidylate kinase
MSGGGHVAARVAEELGYTVVGPETVAEAAETLSLNCEEVERTMHRAPRGLDRFTTKHEQRMALFRAAFYDLMQRDNIVYHGLAGHLFMAELPNVLKVRLKADMDNRVSEVMQREGVNRGQAQRILQRRDRERERWTRDVYGLDPHDPDLYDIYLNLHHIDVDKASKIIVDATRVSTNGHGPIMRKMLRDLALAARAEARLLHVFRGVEATADDGELFIKVDAPPAGEDSVMEQAKGRLRGLEGMTNAYVGVGAPTFTHY